MADLPFDRTNIGVRERPTSGDHNQAQSQIYRSINTVLRHLLSSRTSNTSSAMASKTGFLGDGFRVVTATPNSMNVVITPGIGFAYSPTDVPTSIGAPDFDHVDDLASFKPLPLQGSITFAVPAAPTAPNSRIDIIEVKADRRLENAATRGQFDIGSSAFVDHSFLKTLAFNLDGRTGQVTDPASSTAGISYKTGTVGNPGVVPPTTSGYVKIAEILVANGTTSIDSSKIVDRRPLLGTGGVVRGSARWEGLWNAGAPTVTLLSAVTPPGIDIGIAAAATGKSYGSLYIIGGQITQASVIVQAQPVGGASVTYSGQIVIGALPSARVAEFNAAGIFPGVGQQYVQAFYNAFYQDSAVPAGTQLDDVIWCADFSLAYF